MEERKHVIMRLVCNTLTDEYLLLFVIYTFFICLAFPWELWLYNKEIDGILKTGKITRVFALLF